MFTIALFEYADFASLYLQTGQLLEKMIPDRVTTAYLNSAIHYVGSMPGVSGFVLAIICTDRISAQIVSEIAKKFADYDFVVIGNQEPIPYNNCRGDVSGVAWPDGDKVEEAGINEAIVKMFNDVDDCLVKLKAYLKTTLDSVVRNEDVSNQLDDVCYAVVYGHNPTLHTKECIRVMPITNPSDAFLSRKRMMDGRIARLKFDWRHPITHMPARQLNYVNIRSAPARANVNPDTGLNDNPAPTTAFDMMLQMNRSRAHGTVMPKEPHVPAVPIVVTPATESTNTEHRPEQRQRGSRPLVPYNRVPQNAEFKLLVDPVTNFLRSVAGGMGMNMIDIFSSLPEEYMSRTDVDLDEYKCYLQPIALYAFNHTDRTIILHSDRKLNLQLILTNKYKALVRAAEAFCIDTMQNARLNKVLNSQTRIMIQMSVQKTRQATVTLLTQIQKFNAKNQLQ